MELHLKKTSSPHPAKGSTPDDIYLAVGRALSWWEGAEDVLMGVFRWLCQETEPTAFTAYVASPRGRRSEMLKDALSRYSAAFIPEELQTIRAAMRDLDKLASTRNEIAHGHCSDYSSSTNGVQEMSGAYLLPSLNEGHWLERSIRYAHTAGTIATFESRVRDLRWAIVEAHGAAMERRQFARSGAGHKLDLARQIMRNVEEGRMTPVDAEQALVRFVAAAAMPIPDAGN